MTVERERVKDETEKSDKKVSSVWLRLALRVTQHQIVRNRLMSLMLSIPLMAIVTIPWEEKLDEKPNNLDPF